MPTGLEGQGKEAARLLRSQGRAVRIHLGAQTPPGRVCGSEASNPDSACLPASSLE